MANEARIIGPMEFGQSRIKAGQTRWVNRVGSIRTTRWALLVRPRAFGIAMIIVAFLVHLPTLDQPLLETQNWRQTHTAYNALIFYEKGIDLFRPQLPLFGVPFEFPIEFPIFQALASLVMGLGIAPDVAVRLTALVCFLITGVLVWRLLIRVGGEAAGLAGLAVFLFSPLGLLVGRMSLIEYLATASSLAFIFLCLDWHDRGRWTWFLAAAAAGTIGMLVKPTTAFMYFVPVVALGLSSLRGSRMPVSSSPKYVIAMSVLLGVPVLIGGAWTIYADGVRSSNAATAWFSASSGLSSNYFGTLEQKLDPSTWFQLIEEAEWLMFGAAIWLWTLLGVVAALAVRRRLFTLALVISGALGPLVFTVQYLIPGQEYYMAAVSPFAAIVIGLGSGWLWQRRHQSASKVAVASLAIGWVVTLHLTQGYWGRQFAGVVDQSKILPAADFVAANSRPDELILLAGQSWNPSVFYYARREGFMFRGAVEADELTRFRGLGYRTMFYCPTDIGTCELTNLGD